MSTRYFIFSQKCRRDINLLLCMYIKTMFMYIYILPSSSDVKSIFCENDSGTGLKCGKLWNEIREIGLFGEGRGRGEKVNVTIWREK